MFKDPVVHVRVWWIPLGEIPEGQYNCKGQHDNLLKNNVLAFSSSNQWHQKINNQGFKSSEKYAHIVSKPMSQQCAL